MTRTVTLPAVNMTVSLRQYLTAVKLAKANPEIEFKHGFTTWWPTTGKEIMRQVREGVQGSLNEAIPDSQRGKSVA